MYIMFGLIDFVNKLTLLRCYWFEWMKLNMNILSNDSNLTIVNKKNII